MYLCLLLLPFLSFFSCIFFGRFIGMDGACLLSTAAIMLSFFLSVFAVYEIAILDTNCNIFLCQWLVCDLLDIRWGFLFDGLTVIMLMVVTGVSSLVHLYSTEYLNGDPHLARFMSYLSLFTAFMLILVSADNLVVMFFGWEGIGLASFLLISFWNTRFQANKAAIKAMLVNRLGDIGLALGISACFLVFKTTDYAIMFSLVPNIIFKNIYFFGFHINILTCISLLLFWGVLGKSAQFGLHIWLPDAMEGPTPVSALIHAATLVVAGVFLIIRCSLFFENSTYALTTVSIVGALTAFFAASVGLFQNDLKRVIAYSTCSQLGYMVFVSGLSHYSISLFHLANHAVFKALLFLSAGCVIHGLADEQDLRKMGGVLYLLPVSYTMILIGSLALMGTPFLTGFYSKDCILELAASRYNIIGNFCFFLGTFAACCTAFYSIRLILLVFINPTNTFKKHIEVAHEAPIKMILPLIVLAIGSIFYGFCSRDLMIGFGSLFFNNIFTNWYNFTLIDSEFLNIFIKNTPLVFSIIGSFVSLGLINCYFVDKNQVLDIKLANISLYKFLNKKWYVDQLVNELIVLKIINFGYNFTFQLVDKGFIEKLGPTGIVSFIFRISANLTSINTGFVYNSLYVIIFFAFCFWLFFISFFWNFFTIISINFFLIIFSWFTISLFLVK